MITRHLQGLGLVAALGFPAGAATILQENFNGYPDGPLSNPPTVSSPWTRHSGTGNNLNVQGGAVRLSQADTVGNKDDANRLFEGGVKFKADGDADNANNFLFSSFSVAFTALPTDQGGSYFAHFKSSAASEFYGRIWAGWEGGNNISLRISSESANNGVDAVKWGQLLSLGVNYSVVTRLNVDTGAVTLWVNPIGEVSPSVTSTDTWGFAGEVEAYALRQGTTQPTGGVVAGHGDVTLDNLTVGTAFSSVIPEPNGILGLGALTLGWMSWRQRRKA